MKTKDKAPVGVPPLHGDRARVLSPTFTLKKGKD